MLGTTQPAYTKVDSWLARTSRLNYSQWRTYMVGDDQVFVQTGWESHSFSPNMPGHFSRKC